MRGSRRGRGVYPDMATEEILSSSPRRLSLAQCIPFSSCLVPPEPLEIYYGHP